jgi:hypothetical protein
MADTKEHYRSIILIIATNNTPYFNNCRTVWKRYISLYPSIKFFFVYGKLNQPLEDRDSNDIVYDDVIEHNRFTTIQKSLIAMKYISCNYTYDYLIKTNLSTFWNLNLVDNLLDKCPKEKCYAGGHDLSPFLITEPIYTTIYTKLYSGVCTILTPDIVELFFKNLSKFSFTLPDDISLGLFMTDIECNTYTIDNRLYLENYSILDKHIIEEEINKGIQNNFVYYRVKNDNNREHTDLMIYNYLLKTIYNIT